MHHGCGNNINRYEFDKENRTLQQWKADTTSTIKFVFAKKKERVTGNLNIKFTCHHFGYQSSFHFALSTEKKKRKQ